MKLGLIQEKWLKSLEDNPERQAEDMLGQKNDNGTYVACCLGELLICSGKDSWTSDGELYDTTPSIQLDLAASYQELGLRSAEALSSDPRELALAELNDNGTTWPEIAAIVRANPENYFTKSI